MEREKSKDEVDVSREMEDESCSEEVFLSKNSVRDTPAGTVPFSDQVEAKVIGGTYEDVR